MANQLCALCGGTGSRVACRKSHYQFWSCQACDGDGVVESYGPPTIKLGNAQSQFLRADLTEVQS